MHFISHRGNIKGRIPSKENSLSYIDEAIQRGFMVEVDLRCVDGQLYFGHDTPDYYVSKDFLHDRSQHLWIHAKDHEALGYLVGTSLNYFWHDTDDYTMTSKGYLWAYPGKPAIGNMCVCVVKDGQPPVGAFAICSDTIPT